MAASLIRYTQTSDSIPTSLSVLTNPENMEIAVRILLLSCVRAVIYIISYPLSALVMAVRHVMAL